MQLGLSFSLLLASLCLILSASVEAVPTKRNTGLVTLPLRRLQQRTDVHPTILLQQHINRAHRRHARMTGRKEPSSEQLKHNLLERFNRIGTHIKHNPRHQRPGCAADKSHPNTDNLDCESGSNSFKQSSNAGHRSTSGNAGSGFSLIDLDAQSSGGLTLAKNPTAHDSLGLDIDSSDVGYVATVQAGTPPRDFHILMDTGSADFWIGAEGCQSQGGGGCGNHNFLGPQASSSFVDTGSQFQVKYGSGEVQGNIITDNIRIAGLALNNHTFGVATAETNDFSSNSVPFDGLMGLAQSTLSQQHVPTPVEALVSNQLIPAAITSFKLSRLSDRNNNGEVTFGGLDPTKFDKNTLVTFNNVNTKGFWEGSVSFSVNGQDLGLQGRTAILDTGTTLIVAPPNDAAAVHAQIPGAQSDGQGGFTIPCTSTAVLSMTFGGRAFDIDPQDLLFSPVNPNDLTGNCVSGVTSGAIGGATEWLVGDVFLKNAYFSTNEDNNKISLAKLT
jgi:hypothetical protein